METDAIARPYLASTPFAATLWDASKRALSSFLRRYAFAEDRSTNLLHLDAGREKAADHPV